METVSNDVDIIKMTADNRAFLNGVYSYNADFAREAEEAKSRAIDKDKAEIVFLQRQLLEKITEERTEELLRQSHPTVMDAWEQYQIAMRLVK